MFFVNQRWLGGLLTNFTTIQRSLARLRELEAMTTDGRYDTLSKKEIARLDKERRKLAKNLDGIRGMNRLPDAVFIVDTRHEQIAVDEARKLKIPVIGVVDTNCDPDEVDFVIPGQRRRAALDSAVRGRHRRRGPRRAAASPKRPPRRTPTRRRATPRRAGDAGVGLATAQAQAQAEVRNVCECHRLSKPELAGSRSALRLLPVLSALSRKESHDMKSPQRWSRQLRDQTGAGMMECKAALQEANGDLEEADDASSASAGWRRPAKKSGRVDERRPHRLLHPHGRQDRRPRRGQLRVRLRRAHRRLPDAR